jgi:hypothetical protein
MRSELPSDQNQIKILQNMLDVFSSFCDKIPDRNKLRKKNLFCSWFQRFQSTIGQLHCLGPVARLSVMAEGREHCSPDGRQEAKRENAYALWLSSFFFSFFFSFIHMCILLNISQLLCDSDIFL